MPIISLASIPHLCVFMYTQTTSLSVTSMCKNSQRKVKSIVIVINTKTLGLICMYTTYLVCSKTRISPLVRLELLWSLNNKKWKYACLFIRYLITTAILFFCMSSKVFPFADLVKTKQKTQVLNVTCKIWCYHGYDKKKERKVRKLLTKLDHCYKLKNVSHFRMQLKGWKEKILEIVDIRLDILNA